MSPLTHRILACVDEEARCWDIIQHGGEFIVTDRKRFTTLDLDYNNPLETKYHAEYCSSKEDAERFISLRAIEHAVTELGLTYGAR